jgi:putative acetyltransferase
MPELIRTNSENTDFIALVKLLDADLAIRDGKDHAFYAQFNKIDSIPYVVVAYTDGNAVGCGAIKANGAKSMEIKRMYTHITSRGSGIASAILKELELWTAELDCTDCILETGIKQPEAIALYEKNGYHRIPNYGQYEGVENSLCFGKKVG